MELTEQQIRFADEYVRTGSITEAYRNAYPTVKKESSANSAGSRLFRNVKVRAYIDERLEQLKKESIAEQDEILQFLTSVMRGTATGTTLVGVGGGAQVVEQLPPTVSDRAKAAVDLGKRYAMWTEKQDVTVTGAVQFVDDIGGDDDAT